MKLLAAVLALLCLTGCGQKDLPAPEPDPVPEQSLHAPGHPLEQQTSGIIEVFPTERAGTCQLYTMGNSLLLLDDTGISVFTGKGLRLSGSLSGGVPVYSDADSLWLYDSAGRKLRILDRKLEETGSLTLPEDALGTPGISPEGREIYFLKPEGLYVLDRDSGLCRPLRDNMAAAGGSVHCLGKEILLRLTDPKGEERVLLLSAQDGSSLYEDLSPTDAAAAGSGLLLLSREHSFQKLLLVEPSGGIQELLVSGEETLVCFLPQMDSLITCKEAAGSGITANLYKLSTGQKQSSVILPGVSRLEQGCVTEDGTLYLPAYSREENRWWILRWNYDAFPPDSDRSYLVPFTRDSVPDPGQEALCRDAAQRIGLARGIDLSVLEAAVSSQPWDYTLTPSRRTDETLWALETVDSLLSCFPEGFLDQLSQGYSGLTLCLVDSIQASASGSLDSAMGLQFEEAGACYIALAVSPPEELRATLIHELSHLIDTQVIRASNAYDNWNDLNPQEFSYSLNANADMSRYQSFLSGTNRCFVDEYAMSFPAEDRARILEYAASPGNSDLFVAPVMQQKLKRICTGIREVFSLTQPSGTYLWEQYLVQYGESQ